VKIAFAFPVRPESLMGKGPLLDFRGLPFSKTSPNPVYLTQLAEEAQEQLCLAAWEVANEKRFGQRVSYCLEKWLLETFEAYGLKTALSEKLTERLGLFDPKELALFRPKNKQLVKEWERANAEIHQEQLRVFEQDKADFPDSPNVTEAEKVVLDQFRMSGCRREAIERLRAKQLEKEEATRKEMRGPRLNDRERALLDMEARALGDAVKAKRGKKSDSPVG
jgi:hypothetical protein